MQSISSSISDEAAEGYAEFEALVRSRCSTTEPLFTTTADPKALWGHYLMMLPEHRRQHYNCNNCRRFIEAYGGLATIDAATGRHQSLLWNENPPFGIPLFFRASVDGMRKLVETAKVNGVFISPPGEWGVGANLSKKTGQRWSHLSGEPKRPFSSPLKTAEQRMAELREDHGVLCRSFGEWSLAVVDEAIRVLKADALTRPEKALAIAEWYRRVMEHQDDNNLVWLDVATAPVGFTHIRNTVIATLLDDILARKSFEEVSRRWGEKMHPLAYQRSTKEVTDGAIQTAEKIVAKLGIERAFARRYARLDEVKSFLWKPAGAWRHVPEDVGGVFGHLRGRQPEVRQMALPEQKVTWEKFLRTVLPDARRLEVAIKLSTLMPFFGLVTATHQDAPPVLQWDSAERRNPVSWYFHNTGSMAYDWGLHAPFAEVTGVFYAPCMWDDAEKWKGYKFVGFALKDCKETKNAGLCLFPEILRGDLREIRAVVEANNRSQHITNPEEGTANGLAFNGTTPVTIRVNGTDLYTIDRWD